jgi:hypothetical protein
MIDYAVEFKKQKSLTKKECLKIKPGTWIVLKWLDGENTAVLLLERLENCLGDIGLCYFDPELGVVSRHAVHGQIVGIVGKLKCPDDNDYWA